MLLFIAGQFCLPVMIYSSPPITVFFFLLSEICLQFEGGKQPQFRQRIVCGSLRFNGTPCSCCTCGILMFVMNISSIILKISYCVIACDTHLANKPHRCCLVRTQAGLLKYEFCKRRKVRLQCKSQQYDSTLF